MKMVAAAKLRRAREQAEAARPYAAAMERMLNSLAATVSEGPPLLSGTGRQEKQLIVVATSDRGLCGAFNSSIVRATRRQVRELLAKKVQVKLLFLGRKGYEQLHHEFESLVIGKLDLPKRKIGYHDAEVIAAELSKRFAAGEFDVATIVYNRFKSAISQEVTFQQIIPLALPEKKEGEEQAASAVYEYEPEEEEILSDLLPRNLGIQVYRAMLENSASFYGSQMTAMDNATRNAGDMIKRLNLKYNRTRQAAITKELIEIISGAEAV
jgi:F-type H+-transporting ATPase subunit gamma